MPPKWKLKTRVEDRDTPEEVYNHRVYLCSFIASMAAIMIGYDSAFIAGSMALPSFEELYKFNEMSDSELSLVSANIVSLYQAGCFFGALFAYPIGFYWGRKYGLLGFALFFFIGAGMQLAKSGLPVMYVGRFLAGISIGGCCSLTPIYVAEISPPAIRGRLVGFYEVAWQVGGLIGFWLPYGVIQNVPNSDRQWMIPFGMQLLPCGLFFIGLPYLKESPRFLWSRGKTDKAIQNLVWLRKLDESHPYVQTEIKTMREKFETERQLIGDGFLPPFKEVFGKWKIAKRVILGSSLFMWQNGTGVNAINYYAPTVFRAIGVTGESTPLLTTGVWGCIKTAVCMLWIYILIDKLGRRTLLMLGGVVGGICLFYVGAYIKIDNPEENPSTEEGGVHGVGVSALFFFYVYVVFYGLSWAGTPWIWGSEVFPNHVRTLTQALMAASNWFWTFMISRFTPDMFLGMKNYGPFLFFAACQVVSVVYVWFLIPETKGIPLEAMDILFDGGYTPWTAHKKTLQAWAEETATVYPDDKKHDDFTTTERPSEA